MAYLIFVLAIASGSFIPFIYLDVEKRSSVEEMRGGNRPPSPHLESGYVQSLGVPGPPSFVVGSRLGRRVGCYADILQFQQSGAFSPTSQYISSGDESGDIPQPVFCCRNRAASCKFAAAHRRCSIIGQESEPGRKKTQAIDTASSLDSVIWRKGTQ